MSREKLGRPAVRSASTAAALAISPSAWWGALMPVRIVRKRFVLGITAILSVSAPAQSRRPAWVDCHQEAADHGWNAIRVHDGSFRARPHGWDWLLTDALPLSGQ